MKLEMYDIRAALSEMFVHILPPLKETSTYMVDAPMADAISTLCDQLDPLLAQLHRLLPREVEVVEDAVEKMLGLEEGEMETGLERLIKDIQNMSDDLTGKEPVEPGSKLNLEKKVWTRDNGAQLKLIAGGKKEEGPFNKDKGV